MQLVDQVELTTPLPLLDERGALAQVGWCRQPILDCNLEMARFYRFRPAQRFRIKRWDYYGVTTPTHYFSMTLADLGYAGQVFVYLVDFQQGECHEETLTIPLSRGISLPRNSTEGESFFDNGRHRLSFQVEPGCRRLSVRWPSFGGEQLMAELEMALRPDHESMTIVVPIGSSRFYYNRKVNTMPTRGWIQLGQERYELSPDRCLGNLDWGRGVWEYQSFWVWASASGFGPDGRRVGLNLGYGFGDTSAATENALILDGRVQKLAEVDFSYDTQDYSRPWKMVAPDGRLDLTFRPFLDRVAKTNLVLITSEVHQLFGRYTGRAVADDGTELVLDGLVGFAEEHHARW